MFIADTRVFATVALGLLDSGSITELRGLLASMAREDGPQPSLRDDLPMLAASCLVGVSTGFRSHGLLWPLGRDAQVLPSPVRSQRELTGEALGDVRTWIVANTDELRLTSQCLAMATEPADSARIDTSRHKAIGDVPDIHLQPKSDRASHAMWLRELLTTQSAARATSEQAVLRILVWARHAGITQREVAESLHKPQTYVFRKLQQIDADPSSVAMTPRELLDHFRAGHVSRAELLALLASYPYTRGSYPDEAPDWGYVPGSFDQLTQLAAEGSLSDAELDVVLAGVSAISAQK